MGNLSVGLSGLLAAQSSLELIGTNVANASTAGYHRQEIVLTPVSTGTQGASCAGGVDGPVRLRLLRARLGMVTKRSSIRLFL